MQWVKAQSLEWGWGLFYLCCSTGASVKGCVVATEDQAGSDSEWIKWKLEGMHIVSMGRHWGPEVRHECALTCLYKEDCSREYWGDPVPASSLWWSILAMELGWSLSGFYSWPERRAVCDCDLCGQRGVYACLLRVDFQPCYWLDLGMELWLPGLWTVRSSMCHLLTERSIIRSTGWSLMTWCFWCL